MVKLSVIIITFNEEKNIGRCIDSVLPIADEVLVVDSFSKDNTKKICLSKGVRFIEHAFEGHIQQKNYALAQASFDHVLSLDADEYLSGKLLESIKEAKDQWNADAYKMNRLSSYGGKWIKHGSWYPDRKIRLWDRKFGRWGGENPHDRVVLARNVRVRQLTGDLMHNAYQNSEQVLEKVQQYSSIFAKVNAGKRHSSALKVIGHSFFAFFKSFLLKRGFLDGFEGLVVAAAEGNHVFYKYAKLYEANQHAKIGKRIILSRTDNLGDVILTLPLAGYLKKVIPDSVIFFIGKKYTKSVIEKCTHVDRFIDQDDILSGRLVLKNLEADSIFFVYPDIKLGALAMRAGIRNRVSTSHRWFNWIYCNHLVNFSRVKSDLHESQLNFSLLRPFRYRPNIDVAAVGTYYGLESEQGFDELLNPKKRNVIVHPKSKGSAKEWGLLNYAKLVQEMGGANFQVFITGLKDEGALIRREMPSIFDGDHVTDLTGQMSLAELASFMKNVDGLIAGSTGVLHLAAALGVPVVGLYSPMRPIHPGRWRPIGNRAAYLVKDKDCSACKHKTECECLMSITPTSVAEQLIQVLNNTNFNRPKYEGI